MYKSFFKRIIDFFVALTAFLLVSPFLLIFTLLLAAVNEGKPFFFQRRPGKRGVIFSIIKFKTMNDKKDFHGNLLPDADRLTTVGGIVRKLSIDELPQLINVIKGEMSLIGPRPLLVEYLPLYSEEQGRRHDVKPGITGWAQVNGRNALKWAKKFELDVWYVDHLSLTLDIKIIWLTVMKVLKSEDISSTTSVTMEKFTGND